MSICNDLIRYLNDNNIKFEKENIEKNVYQIAFKLNKQANIFIYENSHIKIFMSLDRSVKDSEINEALNKINEMNVETYGYEIVLLENDYYIIKTIPLMFDIKIDDLINIVRQTEKKAIELYGKNS